MSVIQKRKCCWSRSAPIFYTSRKLSCPNAQVPTVFHGSQWTSMHRALVHHVVQVGASPEPHPSTHHAACSPLLHSTPFSFLGLACTHVWLLLVFTLVRLVVHSTPPRAASPLAWR